MSMHPTRLSGPSRGGGSKSLGTVVCMAFLAGCTWISKTEYESQASLLDQDGDGISLKDGDCDPEDGNVFPGAEEIWYDGIDGDCAGDDDYDADKDGWVATEYQGLETRGVNGSGGLRAGDCDDGNDAINPATPDTWYDGIDSDCAGNDDYDADNDGFASNEYDGEDCYDADPLVYPGAPEIWLDGKDSDCQGDSDFDEDVDGYAPNGLGNRATLYAPGAPVVPDGDCDDTDPSVNEGEVETYYDDKDNDCNPATPDRDQDLDGFETGGDTEEDCDDTDPSSYPGAVETVSDTVDHDCDGGTDSFVDRPLAESGPLFDRNGDVEFSGLYPLEVGAGPNYLWFAVGAEGLDLPLVTGADSTADGIQALGIPLSSSERGFSRRQMLVDFPLGADFTWGDRFGFHATESPGSGGTTSDLLLVGHSIHNGADRMLRIAGYNDRTDQTLGALAAFAGDTDYDDISVALGDSDRVHVLGCSNGGALDIVAGQLIGGSAGGLTVGVLQTEVSLAGEGTLGCAIDTFSEPSMSVSLASITEDAPRKTYSRNNPASGLSFAETYGSFRAAHVDIAHEAPSRVVAHVASNGAVRVFDLSGAGEVSGISSEHRVHILVTGDTRETGTPDYILSGVQDGAGQGWFAVGNNSTGYSVYDLVPADGSNVVDAAAWLDGDGRLHTLLVTDTDTLRYGTALY